MKVLFLCILMALVTDKVYSGPLDRQPNFQSLKLQNPKLEFLGEINGKFFFVQREEVTQYAAESACGIMGMELAWFDSQEEIEFVAQRMLPEDDEAWTAGHVIDAVIAYTWRGKNTPVNSSFGLVNNDRLGLTFARRIYPSSSRFSSEDVFKNHFYICLTTSLTGFV